MNLRDRGARGGRYKILWCTIDRAGRAARHNEWFYYELARHGMVDLYVFRKNISKRHAQLFYSEGSALAGSLKAHLRKTSVKYDLIVIEHPHLFLGSFLENINIPKIMIIEDQHKKPDLFSIDFAAKNGIYIFHRYLFDCSKHNINPKRAFWLPHSFEPMIYKDYGLKKEYGFLQTGTAALPSYPLRDYVGEELAKCKFYKRISRPVKNPTLDKKEPTCVVADGPFDFEYAMELNKAYISLSTGSNYKYAVMKYFEIAASNSLICSDYFKELSLLGFNKNNMLIINADKLRSNDDALKKKIQNLLSDKDKIKDMAKRGNNLVLKRHTNKKRVVEFVNQIKRIL